MCAHVLGTQQVHVCPGVVQEGGWPHRPVRLHVLRTWGGGGESGQPGPRGVRKAIPGWR